MSFWVWVEIVCRGCARQMSGRHVSGPRIPRRDMAREAKEAGWHKLEDEWFCAACKKNRYDMSL